LEQHDKAIIEAHPKGQILPYNMTCMGVGQQAGFMRADLTGLAYTCVLLS
jgi:hypothetical protein